MLLCRNSSQKLCFHYAYKNCANKTNRREYYLPFKYKHLTYFAKGMLYCLKLILDLYPLFNDLKFITFQLVYNFRGMFNRSCYFSTVIYCTVVPWQFRTAKCFEPAALRMSSKLLTKTV